MLKTIWKKTGLFVGELIMVAMAIGPILFILAFGN